MVKCVSALNRIDESVQSLRELNVCLGMVTSEYVDDVEDIKSVVFLAMREIQIACDDLMVSHGELREALKDENDRESD